MFNDRYPSLDEIIWPDTLFDLRRSLLLACRRGSEAHGLWVPPTEPNSIDDRDVAAIVIPPLEFYFGLDTFKHTEAINAPWDVVVEEFRKFIRLLLDQNPNVLTYLWIEREDYLYINPIAEYLLSNRDLFRCREKAHLSFVGYAQSQINKAKHCAEMGYLGAKRKALVEKFGYDTKNAAHLIRLLKMCLEFHETGELRIKRTEDAEELWHIKQGALTWEQVELYADSLLSRCEKALEVSRLPERINAEQVDTLVMKTMLDWFEIDDLARIYR